MLVEQRIRPASVSAGRRKKIVNLHNVMFAEDFPSAFPRWRMVSTAPFSYAKSRRTRVVPPLQLRKNPAQPTRCHFLSILGDQDESFILHDAGVAGTGSRRVAS
jgi:hypothetical protein